MALPSKDYDFPSTAFHSWFSFNHLPCTRELPAIRCDDMIMHPVLSGTTHSWTLVIGHNDITVTHGTDDGPMRDDWYVSIRGELVNWADLHTSRVDAANYILDFWGEEEEVPQVLINLLEDFKK